MTSSPGTHLHRKFRAEGVDGLEQVELWTGTFMALHAKIGELTLEYGILSGALSKAGLLPSAER